MADETYLFWSAIHEEVGSCRAASVADAVAQKNTWAARNGFNPREYLTLARTR